jgi:hypothetical protein
MVEETDEDRLQAVLLHETAHIARHDPWMGLAQRIAVIVFWWNPLVRRVSGHLSELREEICDSHVVRTQGGGGLAHALLDMAARATIRPALPATVGVLESHLDGLSARIARLIDKERNMATRMTLKSLVSVITCGATLLLGMVFIGGFHVVYAQDVAQSESGDAEAGTTAVPASETLLPGTTKGFVSITNTRQLAEQWEKTQLGQLIQDPVMKPFADDLRLQLEERLSNLRKKLGLTINDLKGVPGGELSLAIIQPDEDQVAVALVVDVTDHQEQAQSLLDKVAENLKERGAARSETPVLDRPVTVFELPLREGEERKEPLRVIYSLDDDLLVASDNLGVVRGILGRAAGREGETLADHPAFQTVMERCQKDAGAAPPQIRWFVEPFGCAKAIRAGVPERKRRRGKTLLDHLEATGFAAVRGLGGFVDFAVEGYEMVHRTAIHAPKPYEKSMNMLAFPNAEESRLPDWAPRDLATFTAVQCDILTAFDHIGPIFDQMAAEGEEGTWIDVLDGLKTDPIGPQIDLREELIKHLGPQVIMISDYEIPITTTSERLLFAVEVDDVEAVANALEKTMKGDEGKEVRRREFEGHVIWETIQKEKVEVGPPIIDYPPLGFGAEEREEEEEEDDEGPAPLLPNASVTVANGYLLVGSHYDFLIKILQPIDERETLGRSIDYVRIQDTIDDAVGGAGFLRGFSRTDAEYRATYELIRQGKMPESQTMLGRMLNTVLDVGDASTLREQKIDGSKLPEFEFVRRHLGPAGFSGTTEADGWFFKGFTLTKEAE